MKEKFQFQNKNNKSEHKTSTEIDAEELYNFVFNKAKGTVSWGYLDQKSDHFCAFLKNL